MKEIIIKSVIRSACAGLPEVGKPFEIKLSWDNESREEDIEVTAELLNPLKGGSVAYAAVRVSATDIVSSIETEYERRKQALSTARFVDQTLDKVWNSRGNGDPSTVTVII